MQYHICSGFNHERRVEEQTEELCLYGTQSSTYCCLFLLYHLQPKGHVCCLQESLCSLQWASNFIITVQYDSNRAWVACYGILVPPHPLNWVKLHLKLTVPLLPPLLSAASASLHIVSGPCRMIYGGAHEASCAICGTTMIQLCRGFVIPNK